VDLRGLEPLTPCIGFRRCAAHLGFFPAPALSNDGDDLCPEALVVRALGSARAFFVAKCHTSANHAPVGAQIAETPWCLTSCHVSHRVRDDHALADCEIEE
jgi:hypothetical protein